ncbi:MAG: S8 family serine peptidase [Candidatus Eisenbacteria bacterium]|nr:S8 family serine peptidase [Candidatus Eisenbacteria bacterium]
MVADTSSCLVPSPGIRGALVSFLLGLGVICGFLSAPQPALALDSNEYDGLSYDPGEIVINLAKDHSIESFIESYAHYGLVLLDAYPEANLYLVESSIEVVDDLVIEFCDDPRVEFADANYYQETPEAVRQMVLAMIGGTYEDYEDQELTERIHLDQAHEYGRGHGTLVAVLDTGIDPKHEALVGHFVDYGWDFVDDDDAPWEEVDGIDQDGDEWVDAGFGHGTMVAGVIALVAPQAEILPLRVLDTEGCSDVFRVCKAIRYALMVGADVINMSFGAPFEINAIGHQLWYAYGQGVTVVSGAGNYAEEDPPLFPAAHPTSIMVAAVDSLDVKADFSDWNCKVLVSAPGSGVRSAFPGGNWAIGSGCSFATPFVSGEVALIKSVRPDLEMDAIWHRVGAGTDDLYWLPENKPYWGKLGWGRINLEWAMCGLASDVGENGRSASLGRLLAYPNPSRGVVQLRLATPVGNSTLHASIFDPTGRRVRHLTGPADAPILWDGRDDAGRPVTSGVYFARANHAGRTDHGGTAGTPIRILR